MRIGYSFWGFLGDYKEDSQGNALSTPDGNAAYGGYLIDAMMKAGHDVIFLQQDRDWPAFQKRGKYDFSAFSQDIRFNAYARSYRDLGFPDLDVLLLEWRFPIPGRNTPDMEGKPGYQPDLQRQLDLLRHYKGLNTKIIIWDLDYKLSKEDETQIMPHAVLETAARPKVVVSNNDFGQPIYFGRHLRVEPPVAVSDLQQHKMIEADRKRKLVYVGSRYERDDVIEEWIKPVSDAYPGEVEFWGNWTAEYNHAEVKAKWPNIKYCERITMKDFSKVYSTAVAVPLLAKKEYLANGFITPRIWEAVIFGTLPVGLSNHNGIEEYLPADLVARNPEDLTRLVKLLSICTLEERSQLRNAVVARIEFMDASNFVRVIEGVVNGQN
jgi:hypothetical protein